MPAFESDHSISKYMEKKLGRNQEHITDLKHPGNHNVRRHVHHVHLRLFV